MCYITLGHICANVLIILGFSWIDKLTVDIIYVYYICAIKIGVNGLLSVSWCFMSLPLYCLSSSIERGYILILVSWQHWLIITVTLGHCPSSCTTWKQSYSQVIHCKSKSTLKPKPKRSVSSLVTSSSQVSKLSWVQWVFYHLPHAISSAQDNAA